MAAEILGVTASVLRGRTLIELGGSSLDAGRLAVMLLREYDVPVLAADLIRSEDLYRDLRDLARQRSPITHQAPEAVPSTFPAGTRIPLTWQQRIIWFQSELDPDSRRYQCYATFHFDEPPAIGELRASLAKALRRHPLMRIRLETTGGEAWQVVPPEDVTAHEVDVSEVHLDTVPRTRELLVAATGADRPFDLATGPLVRWTLAHLPCGSATLIHSEHHLIHDGMSFLAFVSRLSEAGGRPADHRYFTYAAAQQPPPQQEVDRVAAECRATNLTTLTGSARGAAGKDLFLRIPVPSELLSAVQETARKAKVSLFTALFAGFADAIGRHQDKTRFVIGSGVSNRPPGYEDAVGMFVSVVPVIVDRRAAEAPHEWLARTDAAMRDAVSRSGIPVQDVVRALGPAARGNNSLFSTVFSLHEQADDSVLIAGRRATVRAGAFNGAAKFPINVVAMVSGGRPATRAELLIEGEGSVVDENDLWAIWSYLVGWLRRLTGWPVGSPRAKATAATPVAERVLMHAEREPERLALRDDKVAITYDELVAIASGASGRLGCGRVAGIVGSASAQFFAVAYAALQGGGTYVPLEVSQPADRLAHMIRLAGCNVLVDLAGEQHREMVRELLTAAGDLDYLCWADLAAAPAAGRPAASRLAALPQPSATPAYIMFTSGSTGVPKGVIVSRHAIDRLCEWGAGKLGFGPGSVVGQGTSISFDPSAYEAWTALWAGATLNIAPASYKSDPAALADWLVAEGVESIVVSTPIAELLMQLRWSRPSCLRILATGGDRLHPVPADLPFRVLNHYGPTEATVVATTQWVEAGGDCLPPIGSPLPYVRIRVVNDDGTEVQPGEPGELWIGGEGVAAGYAGNEAETAAKFVPDPHSPGGDIVYRTGDIVRQRPGAALEFIGRRDRQVKISGVRFELGEIEACALRQPGVRQALASVPGGSGAHLCLFVVTDAGADTGDLGRRIREALPSYLRHTAIRFLADIPLTVSGKFDELQLERLQAGGGSLDVQLTRH